MTPLAVIGTDILSVLTLLAQIFVVVSIGIFVFFKNRPLPSALKYFGEKAIVFSFLIVLFGTLSSLFYSRIVGFEPCSLCVWQRWFLYPQVVLLGYALWKKNYPSSNLQGKQSVFYSGVLSVIGLGIASFHYYGQMFDPSSLPCAVDIAVSSCAFTPFLGFGYITIPMMSFTTFLVLLTLFAWRYITSITKI